MKFEIYLQTKFEIHLQNLVKFEIHLQNVVKFENRLQNVTEFKIHQKISRSLQPSCKIL